ncbi:MAG: 1-deoxy-D-xylulose-5-phosphate reductoisomerase, partial [Solirubrobacterales bacterium]|nr:1-deoxy-D-xylulose-5-phosphate reductoisomerase [Solirubrobacterales bacterium]
LAQVGSLDFESPDLETFRCLALAREAGVAGGTAPCVLNAADEVAVSAFLESSVAFSAIAELVERALDELPPEPVTHFDQLFELDRRARELTRGLVERQGALR